MQRDEPLEDKLVRGLAYQFTCPTNDPSLMEWASVLRGMVEAEASEVQAGTGAGWYGTRRTAAHRVDARPTTPGIDG